MNIAIIGAGDLAIQIAHFIKNDTSDNVTCFFDDYKEKGSTLEGIKIYGGISEVLEHYEKGFFHKVICAIGYNHLDEKKRICESLSAQNIPFYTFIHSSAIVDISATIGEGSVIYPGVIIDQRVVIGTNTILNLGVIVSHDTKIGCSNFLAPNVTIAGFCNIGDCCNIGMTVTVIDNVTVTSNVRIGASSLVLRSINIDGLYVGSPSVKIK